jgi:hypothetical protein
MRRRQFIALLGAIAARPLAVQAQHPEQVRRIAVLMSGGPTDPVTQGRLAAFSDVLQTLGWVEGRNLRIEDRYGAGDARTTPSPHPDSRPSTGTGALAHQTRELFFHHQPGLPDITAP